MRLPEIQLDDRRFQDLVSEARLKINRACPEWTEHNVSDPGITLIELFAWMTEMTIYRLNRVPDKLHVALLDLLGIRLDGPSAARTDVRFRLAARARGAGRDPRRRDRGRDAAHAERGVDRLPGRRGLRRSPRCARPPTSCSAANQIKDVGVADGEARPQGADQLPFGSPPAVGDALYLGFEEPIGRLLIAGRRRRLAGARRRREPGGPAAALGGLPGRRRLGRGRGARGPHRRLQLRLGHGRAAAAPSAARSSRSAATACTGCAAGSTTARATAARPRPTRTRPRSTRSPRRRSARCCPPRTPRGSRTSCSASPTARPARCSRCATARCSSPASGETLEVQDPESGDWSTLGAARGLRRLDGVRPPLRARPGLGRGRARPGDPRDRRRLDPVRRGAAEGRRAALLALPPRRRPARQRRGRRAVRAAQRDPRRRHGHATRARRSAASTPRRSSTRASARRWRSARATAPSPPRTSSSSPARPRRASPARSASRPSDGGAGRRCTSSRTSSPADRQLAYAELVPDEELLQEVAEYLDERRLIGTTVQLLPCKLPRPLRGRQPAGLAARRHRARRGGRRARALHVPQPARRRLGRRARRRLGVRPRAQPGRALRRRARRRRASSS